VLLVAGALLPVCAFAGVVAYRLSAGERAASERRLVRAAQTLAAAVDREASATVRTLQALAQSEALDRDDLAAFHAAAARVASTQPTWLTIILVSPDGRQLVNTRQGAGAPLPPPADPESIQRVAETKRPVIGDLARGAGGEWGVPVRVPVMRGGELRYVLTAVLTPEALAQVLNSQATVDGEWTKTVVDGRGTVVARTRDPERFVGAPGTPLFVARIGDAPQGIYRDTTLDNASVYLAFHRAEESGWTVCVAVPVDVVDGAVRRTLLVVGVVGLAMLLLSGAGAFAFSRRIARAIASAKASAKAMARGKEVPPPVSSSIEEVAALGQAIESSAALLAERERERDANLARAEAARAEAEAASRLKDEFVVTVSHELRTPLNAILGWSKLLQASQLDAAGVARAAEVIARNAVAQARLVDDLLDTSRILSGKLRLAVRPVDLAAVVASAVETVRHGAEAKGVELGWSVEPNLGTVFGDADRLQQVVWNLLSNAVKFTSRGGLVEVRVAGREGRVEIVVRDTGVGIAPEFLPYVFERFRQADGSITRQFGGLGLGLSIVRHLVELHGGTVDVRSEGAGRGAEFTVTLPLARSAGAAAGAAGEGREAERRRLEGVRVLVVDDDRDSREFVEAVLASYGAEVRLRASAAEGLDALASWRPDAILADIGMPGEDGLSFLRKVREREAGLGWKTPAAAITALAREEDAAKAFAVGYEAHIPKPTTPEVIVETVAGLLAHSRARPAGDNGGA
jgi:signal transduction histidine kinase/CheY-like chemotaxis protein